MRLTSAILTGALILIAASTTADGRGIRIESVGSQQNISIGREARIRRSESGILLLGEVLTEKPPRARNLEPRPFSNFRFRRKPVKPSKRTSSRRGFRYAEGLAYSPGTRNVGRYRSDTFRYGSGFRHNTSFSYGGGGRYSGPVRYRNRDAYKPNIQYGRGIRYGEELRQATGRQR